MAVEMTVGPAVADGKLGSLMGLSFFNVDVPPTHTTSHHPFPYDVAVRRRV